MISLSGCGNLEAKVTKDLALPSTCAWATSLELSDSTLGTLEEAAKKDADVLLDYSKILAYEESVLENQKD